MAGRGGGRTGKGKPALCPATPLPTLISLRRLERTTELLGLGHTVIRGPSRPAATATCPISPNSNFSPDSRSKLELLFFFLPPFLPSYTPRPLSLIYVRFSPYSFLLLLLLHFSASSRNVQARSTTAVPACLPLPARSEICLPQLTAT